MPASPSDSTTRPGARTLGAAHRVRIVVCKSGERLPILVRCSDGLPPFAPNLFAVSQVRGRSRASNTIERCLRSLLFLLAFLELEGIDLEERLASGMLLDPHEVDRLADAARRPVRELTAAGGAVVRSLHRRSSAVSANAAATRLQYVRQYLAWLSSRRLAQLKAVEGRATRLLAARDAMIAAINARMPSGRRDPERRRMGLTHEEEAELLKVIDPGYAKNPWIQPEVRQRNQLIVLWLLQLGLRGGELLSARLNDLNFRLNELEIVRRHHSKDDPRRKQPVVKTHGRALPIEALADLTEHFVLQVRRSIPGARRHPFLFVSLRSGVPLSASSLTKIFRELRTHPNVPARLTPHLLRHTWNDRFSEAMDRKGTPEPEEEGMRNYLQGWTPGSDTASTYTRRHVREKAREASLALQRTMVRRGLHERP